MNATVTLPYAMNAPVMRAGALTIDYSQWAEFARRNIAECAPDRYFCGHITRTLNEVSFPLNRLSRSLLMMRGILQL